MTTAPVPAADLPPYTFDQPCPQCRRRGPQMVIFERDCAEVIGAHYHRECRRAVRGGSSFWRGWPRR